MADSPMGGHDGGSLQNRTELTNFEDLRAIVREDVIAQEGAKFFVDSEVFYECYPEIRNWLSVESLGPHLLRRKLIGDVSGLVDLRNPYHTVRERTDHLLTLANSGGPYGFHVLYICIREDDENLLGHRSAVETLRETALRLHKTPPTSILPSTLSIEEHGDHSYNDDQELGGQSMGNTLPTTTNATTTPTSARPSVSSTESPVSYSMSPMYESRRWPQTCPPGNTVRPSSLEVDGISPVVANTAPNTTISPMVANTPPNTTISPVVVNTPPNTTISPVVANTTTVKTVGSLITATTPNGVQGPGHPKTGASPGAANTGSQAGGCMPTKPIPERICQMLEQNDKVQEDKLRLNGTDIQLSMDYQDLQDLLDSVVQFIGACLNSRASGMRAGVLVAGVESWKQGYHIDGLNFSLPRTMYEQIRDKLKDSMSCQKPSDGPRQVDANAIMKMVTPVACNFSSPKQKTVLIVVVEPQVTICRDDLYLVKCGRKLQVYKRLGGGINHVVGGCVQELHQELQKQNLKLLQ